MRNSRIDVAIGWLAVLPCALSLMALAGLPSAWWSTDDQRADRLFKEGSFEEAAQLYTDVSRRGAAFFRAGDFKSSAGTFARLDTAESAFNRGNALIMLGKYDDAITSFDRAIQFRPDWQSAIENRAIAVARRDRMAPPDDDAGETGGQLEADEYVFDDRAKNASQTEDVEVGKGEKMSDEEMRQLWLRRVQTKPGDFLKSKFSYQLAKRGNETK